MAGLTFIRKNVSELKPKRSVKAAKLWDRRSPVLLDSTGTEIIAGDEFVKAAKAAKVEAIDCGIINRPLNKEQKQNIREAYNAAAFKRKP